MPRWKSARPNSSPAVLACAIDVRGCGSVARIRRLSLGNFGDVKPVGGGISEMRVYYGPGYRVYLVQRGETLVILLAGGDKSTQNRDIARARELARED